MKNFINPVFLSHLALFLRDEVNMHEHIVDKLEKCKTSEEVEMWFSNFADDLHNKTAFTTVNELENKISELEDEVTDLEGDICFLQTQIQGPFKGMIDNMKFQVFKENIDKFNLEQLEQLLS